MTIDEEKKSQIYPSLSPKFSFYDTLLKHKCLRLVLENGLPKDDNFSRAIPPGLSNFLFGQLDFQDSLTLTDCSKVSYLYISSDFPANRISSDAIRAALRSHVEILKLENCAFPSKYFDTRDILSLQAPTARLSTLDLSNITISSANQKFIAALGASMQRISNLHFGAVSANDSIMQTDELFIAFARENLSKNRNLFNVDLRGSDVDLVATSSRRNLPINFAAEMRRWARRLRSLAFETDVNVSRVLRILNRQCPMLKSLCLRTRSHQVISNFFDNLKVFSNGPTGMDQSSNNCVEPFKKLERLCLCANFRINDSFLASILPSLPGLKYLNVSGCPVNFESYWSLLPTGLEELVLDEFTSKNEFLITQRHFIKSLCIQCPNLKIYISSSIHHGNDLDSLKGLALLTGAHSCLHRSSGHEQNFPDFKDDRLNAFELRVLELNAQSHCIKLF